MHMIAGVLQYVAVASFAEAWIEKISCIILPKLLMSPPSRRRGLKISLADQDLLLFPVASFAEAWIENVIISNHAITLSRLLRGGVD